MPSSQRCLKRVLGAAGITSRGLLMASKNKSRMQRARPEGRLYACLSLARTRITENGLNRRACVRACVLATSAKLLKRSQSRQLGTRRKRYPAVPERKSENVVRVHKYIMMFVRLKPWNDIAYLRLKISISTDLETARHHIYLVEILLEISIGMPYF